MYYIQETDKPNFLLKKLNIVKLENDKIILPTNLHVPIKLKEAQKLTNKIEKILSKTNSNKIILSKNLKKQEMLLNKLYTYNFNIVDGKWLFETLSYKVLEYISKKKNIKEEETRNIYTGK